MKMSGGTDGFDGRHYESHTETLRDQEDPEVLMYIKKYVINPLRHMYHRYLYINLV